VVKIRLTRVGGKKNAIYRVVVADARSPRDGRTIETIGRYNPQPDPSIVEIDLEKADRWIADGAQPTPAVRKLLKIVRARGEATPAAS
jgi:small subunit ribosomal protein S16